MFKPMVKKPKYVDSETLQWVFSMLVDHMQRQDISEPASVIASVANEAYGQELEPWDVDFLSKVEDEGSRLEKVLPSGGDALDAYCLARECLQNVLEDLDELKPRKA